MTTRVRVVGWVKVETKVLPPRVIVLVTTLVVGLKLVITAEISAQPKSKRQTRLTRTTSLGLGDNIGLRLDIGKCLSDDFSGQGDGGWDCVRPSLGDSDDLCCASGKGDSRYYNACGWLEDGGGNNVSAFSDGFGDHIGNEHCASSLNDCGLLSDGCNPTSESDSGSSIGKGDSGDTAGDGRY